MATIAFSPDSGLKVGDTVTVVVTDAPKGRNYVTVAVYPAGAQYWAERKTIRGSEDVSFVLGGPGLLYGWLDDDADMGDGFVAFAAGGEVAP